MVNSRGVGSYIMTKLNISIDFFKLKVQSLSEHWTRLWSANRGPRFSIKDRSRHPVGKRNISAKTVSFFYYEVERCYLLCNVLPTVYVTRMQILHQYLKVNKQHAQFSNKQTMTMISASDFLSKCFSKMRKLRTKPGSTTSRLIHVMPCIRDYLRR